MVTRSPPPHSAPSRSTWGPTGRKYSPTARGGDYRRFSGTSSATPHVTGVAALLYSAPCQAFAELLRADPAAAARYVRRIILETARSNSSLAGKSVTGGQLDAGAAMARLMRDCNRCFAPTGFTVTPAPGSASALVVNYNAVASIDAATLRYRAVGATDWTELNQPSPPLTLADLPACVAYEFELRAACGTTALATQRLTASSDGCCAIPGDFRIFANPGRFFTATWSQPLAGTRYNVRYRKVGDSGWTTRTSTQSSLGIAGGIDPCTPYEFEFRTACDGEQTDFGARRTVTSRGCGACLEAAYCTPNGYTNTNEWIAEVNFANQTANVTGADRGGYGDYTGAEITVVPGGVYPITMRPGSAAQPTTEAFKVYVDWNQDGALTSGEVVADLTSRDGDPVSFDLEVPENAPTLSTRMRVIMNFIRVSGGACATGRIGEYEDYCLNIQTQRGCPAPERLTARFDEDSNTFVLSWGASATAGGSYRIRYRPRGSEGDWVTEDVEGLELVVDELNFCGAYEVELASLCGGQAGPGTLFNFSDTCVGTDDTRLPDTDWQVVPNPAVDHFRLIMYRSGALRPASLRLLDVTGSRVMYTAQALSTGNHIDLRGLPTGIYFAELTAEDGRRGVKKLIVR